MTRDLTSPDGTPITIRPIEPGELDRIPLRCWPEEHATLDHLFAQQGTIGMAAWEGDKCVAELHGYRVALPDGRNEDWPEWNRWWPGPAWRLEAAREVNLPLSGPAWCHACCHVGRTLESTRNESEPSELGKGFRKGIELQYLGRGIGTALCRASALWAREHDYVAVMALGAPDRLFNFAVFAGHLPWTTYAKLGFKAVNPPKEGDGLPDWAQDCPPKVVAEIQAALAAGRPEHEINERLMVLDLRPQIDPASE